MGDASNLQTSFLGGEWSPYAQGRAEDRDYRNALSVCRNGYPVEAGAWIRRQGTRFCATTRYGQPGWLLPFWFTQNAPYTMEFTNQSLRFFNGPNLVGTNDVQTVLSISAANPAVVTTQTNHGWSNGNMVYFIFKQAGSQEGDAQLFMRQFIIGGVSGATFTISDPITGAGIDGSLITYAPLTGQVVRIQEIASPYNSQVLTSINKVQAQGTVVTLCPGVAPYALVRTTAPSAAVFAQFSFNPAVFLDGPYLSPNTSGTITPSAKTGSITLAASGAIFASTDVGRSIRLFSEPAAWAAATAYTTGNTVKNTDGLYYTALANSTGKQPDLNPTLWALNSSAAIWTWATITAFTNANNVTALIKGPDLLYTTAINSFRLGVYSDTTGYPTCGVYHEGRLWLSGAVGNRIDGSAIDDSQPAGTFNFAPTASDGTVSDSNAISYVFNAQDVNPIFWMEPYNAGIVCGTQGGEWMVAASTLNDPLTPTSIQAHRRSKYKCANIQPVSPGFAVVFVQLEREKTIEYVADVFSPKLFGRNLNEKSKHLTTAGIAQLAYQQERAPIIWARRDDGALIGATYKRENAYPTEPPSFNGWHRHDLGTGRIVESLSVGPSVNGTLESLTIITNQTDITQSDYGVRHVEILTDMFDENSGLYDAWFCDDALTPSAMSENVGLNTLTCYGYYHLAGKTVDGWIAGIDAGQAVVAADGSVQFPVNAAGSLLTDAALNTAINSGEDYGGLGVYLDRTVNVSYPVLSGNSVQSYIATNAANGYVDDPANNRIYSIATGVGTTASIAIFDRLTGQKILERTQADIFGSGSGISIDDAQGMGVTLGKDGYLYFAGALSNTCPIVKVRASDLTFAGQFGVTGGIDYTNTTALHPTCGVHVSFFKANFLVLISSLLGKVGVINTDAMQWYGHSFAYTEGNASGICAGESVDAQTGYASAYSVASNASQISLYKTVIKGGNLGGYSNPPTSTPPNSLRTNPSVATTKIVTIAAATIDAGWSGLTASGGCAYDPSDGNIIVLVFNSAGTNKAYIMKLNSQTGAIIWKTATLSGGEGGQGIRMSTFENGRVALLDNSGGSINVRVFNTVGGANTSNVNIPMTSGQFTSVGVDGSITGIGSWGGSTLHGLNGTTSFSNRIFKLQGFTGFPGNTTQTQSGIIPAVIGLSYTSQGERLRPIAQDATGARNGPALGKTRRVHRTNVLLSNTQGISFGGTLSDLLPAKLTVNPGDKSALPLTTLFNGVHSMPIKDEYDYDGMTCWQVTRPYPAVVVATGDNLETQDR